MHVKIYVLRLYYVFIVQMMISEMDKSRKNVI